ncbi:MAG: hypothetical protein NTW19_11875 [Planctomycetota bacterium]|nr:hypothetical protein [Planctomycetota bacterium]
MQRERLGQLRLASRAQVVEQLGPGLQARPPDDPLKLGPQVHGTIPASGDGVLRPRFGRLECRPQVGQKLGEDRDQPRRLALVMLCLGAAHVHAPIRPIHVTPAQGQVFGRAAHAGVAAQGEDQPPLGIGAGRQHLFRILPAHEPQPLGVRAHRALDALERVAGDQLATDRRPEILSGSSANSTDRVVRHPLAQEVQAEGVGVSRGDAHERLALAEVAHNHLAGVFEVDDGPRLGIDAAGDIGVDERPQLRRLGRGPRRHQPGPREAVVQRRADPAQPHRRLAGYGLPVDRRAGKRLDMPADLLGVALAHLAQAHGLAASVGRHEKNPTMPVGV